MAFRLAPKIKPNNWDFEYQNIYHQVLPMNYPSEAMRLYQTL